MDSINLYYPPQAKQLSEIFKVMQIPHKFFIDLIYGRPSKAHYWQKILGFNDGVHFFSELPLCECQVDFPLLWIKAYPGLS